MSLLERTFLSEVRIFFSLLIDLAFISKPPGKMVAQVQMKLEVFQHGKFEPMKRILIVLTILVSLLVSSQSLASSFSFGISLQAVTDLKRIFPLGAIQIGYDFGTASEGFSLEAYGFTIFLINELGLQGFYRFPVSSDGSNLYVGAGASVLVAFACCVDASGSGGFLHVHGLVGWEAPINPDYTYFLEAAPGINTNNGDFFLRFSIGLRAHRTEFLTRNW
jgi:hypothetical protein